MTQLSLIPTIDLKPLWGSDIDLGIKDVANQLKESLAPIGFAYLINHQIPQDLFDDIFKEAYDFHNLPSETKLRIKQNNCFRGYMPNKASQLKVSTQGEAAKPNQLESFIMAFEVSETHPDYKEGLYLAGPNQWPKDLPNFKEVVYKYRDAMLQLAYKLLKAFAVAFGLGQDDLNKFFENPSYFLRLQYYPEWVGKIPEGQFGIAPHTDYGFLTLLAQDNVGGLEVKLDDGRWVDVPSIPNTLVLNAGDTLRRWSNDTFRSVPHRVINHSNKPRYSVPFFFEPDMHAIIKVLETCITDENPVKHVPIMYGEYLLDRVQGNYGLGKRAQSVNP